MSGNALKNKALQALSTGKVLTAWNSSGDSDSSVTTIIEAQEEAGDFCCALGNLIHTVKEGWRHLESDFGLSLNAMAFW